MNKTRIHIDRALLILIVVLFLSSSSCTTKPGIYGPQVEGFQAFPTPRAFDGPGKIIRIAPDGTQFGVTKLALEAKSGIEQIPEIKWQTTLSLGSVLETVGASADIVPAKHEASFAKKDSVTLRSVEGRRYYLDDVDVDKHLANAFDNVRVRRNNKYYLIRETIVCDNLDYTANKSWIAGTGIEAEFRKMIKANAKLKWGDEAQFSIKKKFSKPLNVWYKLERLEIVKGFGAATGQQLVVTRKPIEESNAIILKGPLTTEP